MTYAPLVTMNVCWYSFNGVINITETYGSNQYFVEYDLYKKKFVFQIKKGINGKLERLYFDIIDITSCFHNTMLVYEFAYLTPNDVLKIQRNVNKIMIELCTRYNYQEDQCYEFIRLVNSKLFLFIN